MKNRKKFLIIGSMLIVLFSAVSIFTFSRSRDLIEQGYLASEGNAAENFAILTAANIRLTDEQVNKLKQFSYSELLMSDENEALRSMMVNESFTQKVHYAYVMLWLPEEDIRYSVTEEMQEKYDAPVGTKLDIMWLLDVNVGESAEEQASYSNELSRYAYYIEEDEKIFEEAPTYVFNSSEWGDHICGYAPLLSVEGNYIGVMGVELETQDYAVYCRQAVFALGVLMIVCLLMLSLLFVYIYVSYRNMQFDRIYVDSLVHIYNRSYFNNRFDKYMNTHRNGSQFALMIADVDWFKKVNDTFGHEAGDEVLIEIGAILKEHFGKANIVRFGGEEFVVGLWFDDEEVLRKRLDELFSEIAAHSFSSRGIELSISLGCAYYDKPKEVDGWLISSMLRAADCKLYEAKESGRRKYLIEEFDSTKVYDKDVSKTQTV